MFLIDTIVARKTRKKGQGVFATADIPAGTVVGDYLGTLIRDKEENEKEQGLYCMSLDASTSILAHPKESGIHLINHSCTPNTAMYPVGNHTIYFALRKIYKGEEVTVSYLLDQPDKDCNPCRHACFCGEEFCTGTMHCSSNDVQMYLKFEAMIKKQQRWRDTKFGRVPYGKRLQPLEKYPASIPDYPVYNLFASSKKRPIVYKMGYLPKLSTIREYIRTTGRACAFPKMGMIVTAVRHTTIEARVMRAS